MDIHYVHDALGRRIGKIRDGNLEKGWLYADALNPIAQLDSAGQIEASFIYGTRAHVPDAMVMTDGTVYRLITDHLGSVRLVVNAETGAVVQRMDYDAFGRVLSDSNPDFQPFGYAGGLYDADTGLVRFGARDYDAYAGRWTTKDASLFGGGDENLYRYALSDSVNLADVNGEDVCIHRVDTRYQHRFVSFDGDPNRSYGAWPANTPWNSGLWGDQSIESPDPRSGLIDEPETLTACISSTPEQDRKLEKRIRDKYDFSDPTQNPPYIAGFNDCRHFVREAVQELIKIQGGEPGGWYTPGL